MSDDLRTLYQEVILDHYRKPRNFREIEPADCRADGYNPMCGDEVTIYLSMEGDVVKDVSFQGTGCAISTASASLMTEAIKGKSREEAEALLRRFQLLVTTPGDEDNSEPVDLGKLEVLSGVRDYPVRIKCATLAWHALRAALENNDAPVTTE